MRLREWMTDGTVAFMGITWGEDPDVARLAIAPELINPGGMLSGVVAYALVDYGMGSTLWSRLADDEGCATITIAINYVATAREGELTCTTTLDRRTRSNAVLRSEVSHEDGRLLATAVGSYSIFPRRGAGPPVSP